MTVSTICEVKQEISEEKIRVPNMTLECLVGTRDNKFQNDHQTILPKFMKLLERKKECDCPA